MRERVADLRVVRFVRGCGRRELAAAVALALFGIAVLDLVLRIGLTSASYGWLMAAHDPGKVLFHLILLPAATFLLICQFPASVFRKLGRGGRIELGVVAVGLFALTVWFTGRDMQAGFCERGALPENVRDPALRSELLALRGRLWEDVRRAEAAHAAGAVAADAAAAGAAAAPRSPAREAKQTYEDTTRARLGPSCDVRRQGSARAYTAGALTGLGMGVVSLIFVTLAAHAVAGRRLASPLLGTLLAVCALLTPWLLLRPYSELYYDFGFFDANDYRVLWSVLAAAGAVGVLGYFLWKRGHKTQVVLAGLFAGVSGILGVLTQLEPDYFSAAARQAIRMDPPNLVLIYAVVILTTYLMFRFLAVGQEQDGRDG